MKQLPIGIQNIREVIEGGYLYIDKTAFAYQLIKTGKHYFIARPRRFGKSLFIDTLAEILRGNKALFRDCVITQKDYDWQTYPIVLFNFEQMACSNPLKFEESLRKRSQAIAQEYALSTTSYSIEGGLGELIMQLYTQYSKPVVVLVDAYDKPITSTLQNESVAKSNQEILRNYFGVLKELGTHLKLTFMTGVRKPSESPHFSDTGYVKDITVNPRYAALMGYTESEFKEAFSHEIDAMVQEREKVEEHFREQELLQEIRQWYNGYRFSSEETSVYHPFSTLFFINEQKAKDYSYDTTTPDFLTKKLRLAHDSCSVIPIRKFATSAKELTGSNLYRIELTAWLFQEGYLTIKDYHNSSRQYTLEFPNREARLALIDILHKPLVSQLAHVGDQCYKHLRQQQITAFFEVIYSFFNKLHRRIFSRVHEASYAVLFSSILKAMGLDIAAEVYTRWGPMESLVRLPGMYYVFQTTLDQSASSASRKIHKEVNIRPYLKEKHVTRIGVNFSSKSRNIQSWDGIELTLENGKEALVRYLGPERAL